MRIPRWTLGAALLSALALGAGQLSAQVTTGVLAGTVTGESGQPVEGAQIRVVNRTTGFQVGVLTHGDGRYTVAGLEVGSNYSVTVRRIGFQPQTHDNVAINLGQTTRLDLRLSTQAAQISGVVVTAAAQNQTIAPSHTGAVTAITDSALRRLPSLNRNFTDFVALTPQISTTLQNGGLSGAGSNNRYNNVQIDGTTEADVFGLGSTGQPGGQAGGKSIGIESVKEYQVLLSPYDVRQGNFAGALINAVTKSGTNDWHGSVYGVARNQEFTRSQPYINKFSQSQYGLSLGGPIVRDKAFFFINPEFQRYTSPATGVYFGQQGLSLTQAQVDSFTNLLQGYGYPAQGIGSPGLVNNTNPLQNLFARLDFNLPHNSTLVLRDNYGHADEDIFGRTTAGSGSFPFSSNGYRFKSSKNAPAMQLRTLFSGGTYNELLVGLTQIRDRRAPNTRAPQVSVTTTSGYTLTAGAERFSQGNELDQDIFEVTDNITVPVASHRFTIGTQNQFMKFRNLFTQASYGVWSFTSLSALAAGTPSGNSAYVVGVPLSGDGAVRFKAQQYGLYAQDEWAVTQRFNLQYGIRADVPIFPSKPPANDSVQFYYGLNTSNFPSGNLEWSPRVGFNWDVTGDEVNQLRGGIGLFAGRPAYVWLSNGFQNSGSVGVGVLTCNAAVAPAFNSANIATPPSKCTNGLSAKAGGEIDLVDKNLKFPQNLRATLGYDRRIGDSWIATLEGIYTRGLNGLFYENIALAGVANPSSVPKSSFEAGRWIYGPTPNSPTLRPGGRSQIFYTTNQSKDYAYNLTGGLQHRFTSNFEGSAYYTYSRSFDVQSFTSSTAFSQYRYGRAWGYDQTSTALGRSVFEERNRIVAQGTYSFPTRTDVSFEYFGESGTPFGYVVNQDVNGDGISQNDPIYVPRNALDTAEITFGDPSKVRAPASAAVQAAAFENFIKSTPCLREHRGQLLPRNACDNPWTNTVNVSLRQSLPTARFQNVSVQLDVFNFLNLLNDQWGIQPSAGFGSQPLLDVATDKATGRTLQLTGPDLVTGRPVYTFNPNYKQFLSNSLGSNYQIQLQLRYSF